MRTDGRTDRHDEANSGFRNFANAPNNGCDNTKLCFPEISMVPSE